MALISARSVSFASTPNNRAGMMMRDLDRYERFGWDYPLVAPLGEDEVRWHVQWAKRMGGPVLGLACGTARLLCRLAEAGFESVGLDLSDGMLRLAQDYRARLATDARDRLHLAKGDMANFNLGRRFALILLADNSFRELPTRKALLACLRLIRRHLLPTGMLLITERRFDPSLYPSGERAFEWSGPVADPETGLPVCRKGCIRVSRDRRRLRGTFIYRTTAPDGRETLEEFPWSAPVLTLEEYLGLFAAAGFRAEVFGDYQHGPLSESAKLWCFACAAIPAPSHTRQPRPDKVTRPDPTDYRMTWESAYRRSYAQGKQHWRPELSTPPAFSAFLLSALAPPRGAVILEAGCGDGLNCLSMARLGYRVSGVDVSQSAIARAREVAGRQHANVEFLCLDLVRGRLPAGYTCDLWVDIKTLHVLWEDADRQSYLAGTFAALRPGGRLFLNCALALADVKAHFPTVFASLDRATQAQADILDRTLPRGQRAGIRGETLDWYCQELAQAGFTIREARREASIKTGWGAIILAERPMR